MADKIIIDIGVKGDADKQLARITIAIEEFGKKTEESLKKATSAWDVFKGVISADVTLRALDALVDGAKKLFDIFIVDGIRAASEQEDAINKLNQSLIASGKFTAEASQELQDFASALQLNTKFSDEAIIGVESLIQSLGRLDKDTLQQATKAALDMAAALGIDLETAARAVGKAATGETGALSKFGIKIQEGADVSQTFALALERLNSRFGGAAESQLNTYSGAVAKLENIYGELLESTGEIITKNPAVIILFNELAATFLRLNDVVKENSATLKIFAGFLIRDVADALSVLVKIGSLITGSKTLQELADSLKRVREEFDKSIEPATFLANETKELDENAKKAAASVGQLSSAQEKLADEGRKLIEQAAKQDPEAEFAKRVEALNAAVEQEIGLLTARNDAYAIFDEERRKKAEEELTKEAEAKLLQNDVLIAEGGAANAELIRQNNEAVQQILQNEDLSSKDRAAIQKRLFDQSTTIEKNRATAISNSLNALATLQRAKTKEIAIVGKAAAIAETTINTYKAATAAYSALAGIPIVGPILGAAAAGAAIAAGLFNVAQISGVELQSGITEVPPGFQNDSFAARLSTGERVVDAGTNQDLKVFLASSVGMSVLLAAIVERLDNLENRVVVNIGNRIIIDEVREAILSGRVINAG